MITFSVITCTYNASETLQRTLNCVLSQTWPHVEHLIIDGASTDGTLEMALRYKENSDVEENGHSVTVVSERDKGLYDAMNKGLDRATGTYVVFLNAGDVYPSPDTLELIAGSVGEDELLPGVLYGDTDIVDATGHFLRHRRLQPPEDGLSWHSFRQGMLVCHQAFYARMDLAKRTHYDLRYRYSADVDWCIRIMKAADHENLPLKNVEMVAVNFLDGGMTTKYHRASLRERFRVMCRHYGFLSTLGMHLWFVFRAVFKK